MLILVPFSFLSFLSFLLISFLFLSFLPFFQPSFSGVRFTTAVPGIIPLLAIRDGIPQLVIVQFPLRTGTALHVLVSVFSSMGTRHHGLAFGKMS